eukprot:366505-Chlamydomonas_euryale.AAC.16
MASLSPNQMASLSPNQMASFESKPTGLFVIQPTPPDRLSSERIDERPLQALWDPSQCPALPPAPGSPTHVASTLPTASPHTLPSKRPSRPHTLLTTHCLLTPPPHTPASTRAAGGHERRAV